jgi:hypothetical protein
MFVDDCLDLFVGFAAMNPGAQPLGFAQPLAAGSGRLDAILDHGHAAIIHELFAAGDIHHGNLELVGHQLSFAQKTGL